MAGFLQIFSVRCIGCGGLGEVNQSSTTGDKRVRLINSGDRSAPMYFGNSFVLSALVCKAWICKPPSHFEFLILGEMDCAF